MDAQATLAREAERRGTSLAALSRMIGRNPAYLQQFVKRGTPRRLDEGARRHLAAFFGVEESALGGPARDADMVAVRRIDAAASAGPGGLVEDDRAAGEERIDPRVAARLGVAPGSLTMITARGDSMEPLIHDGDALFVDMSDRRLSSRPGLFVLRLDGALLVKRVARIGFDLHIASDNPAAPVIAPVRADKAEIIGRVVRLARSLK
ncbi:MAG: LexA family transcriptional regulator [Sphingomonas sp.]|uniref:S24 family peptidase n=1 Tax=Sphingomonas sp. TaxID=28214 RepID=UPI001219A96F|nr:LexA family transcriptional regulator [Sphingomonas sp.]THD38015.1 MAG: LexA family transcriptional regulator [Sphingomonas sp.]